MVEHTQTDGHDATGNNNEGPPNKRKKLVFDDGSDPECDEDDDSVVINKENLINSQNDGGEGETNNESSSEYDSQAESSSDFDSDSDSDSDDNQWNDDNENVYETCSDISSDSEDDGVVSSIKTNKKKKKEINPSPLVVQNIISCISFSPINDTVAVGSMVGTVKLYDYNQNTLTQQILKTKHIIRALEWCNTGETMYVTDSNNKCHIVHVDKNVRTHTFTNPEECPVYCIKAVEDNKLITGDDNGVVRVWDLRTQSKSSFRGDAESTVTSVVVVDSFISATTVDGHVFGFDMRNKKNIQKSEQFSAEINCSGLFKSDRKLVCGTSDGNLIMFSWNRYDNWEDQYKPSVKDKSAINCLLPITEHIALTGTDTGIIRATNLYPMKRLGIVGSVEMINGRQSGIHAMDINYSGNIFGVSTMDMKILFYNISCMKYVNFKNPKYSEDYLFPTTNKLNRSEFFTGLE